MRNASRAEARDHLPEFREMLARQTPGLEDVWLERDEQGELLARFRATCPPDDRRWPVISGVTYWQVGDQQVFLEFETEEGSAVKVKGGAPG